MADDIKIGEIDTFVCVDNILVEKATGIPVEFSAWDVGGDDDMHLVLSLKPDMSDNKEFPETLWIEATGILEGYNEFCRGVSKLSMQLNKDDVVKLIELLQVAVGKMSDYHEEEESP